MGKQEETTSANTAGSSAIRLSSYLLRSRPSGQVMRGNALRWVGFGSGCCRRRPSFLARFQRIRTPRKGAPLQLSPLRPSGRTVKLRMMGSLYQYTSQSENVYSMKTLLIHRHRRLWDLVSQRIVGG